MDIKKWYSHLTLGKENINSHRNDTNGLRDFEVHSGSVTENVGVVRTGMDESLELTVDYPKGTSYVMQIKEVIPDHERGMAYKYKVYIGETLVHIRDYKDCGGGPYISTFIQIDKALMSENKAKIRIEICQGHVYFSDIFIYPDMASRMEAHDLWDQTMEIGFLLSGYDQVQLVEAKKRAQFILDNIALSSPLKIRFMILVPFLFNLDDPSRVNSEEEEETILATIYELQKEFGIPIEVRFISDWSGTPSQIKDKDGSSLGDVKYQQITYSTDHVKEDSNIRKLFENNEDSRIKEYYANDDGNKTVHFGEAVSLWGDTPWLSFNDRVYRKFLVEEYQKMLHVYSDYRDKIKLRDGHFPFTSDCGIGHEILYFSSEVDRQNRKGLIADFNPQTIIDSNFLLDPRKGYDLEQKMWHHNNLATFNTFLAETIYAGLKREAIIVTEGVTKYPDKLIKHRIRSEPYAYPMNPLLDELYPVSEVGITDKALPGSQWFHSDVFKWLQKHREFGIIANPNDECMGIGNERPYGCVRTPEGFASDLIAQLRLGYALGCEYMTFYNWWRYLESIETIKSSSDAIIEYWSYKTGDFSGEVEFDITEENKFNNKLMLTLEENCTIPKKMYIQITDTMNKIIAYRTIVQEHTNNGSKTIETDFNELFCLYPDKKYRLKVHTSDGEVVKCKDVWIGADLTVERRRSHLIGNRRYADTLIERISSEVTSKDQLSEDKLNKAKELAMAGSYQSAIKSTVLADVLRLPIQYLLNCQCSKEIKLKPFQAVVLTDRDAILKVEVVAYETESLKMLIQADKKCTLEIYSYDFKRRKQSCNLLENEWVEINADFIKIRNDE